MDARGWNHWYAGGGRSRAVTAGEKQRFLRVAGDAVQGGLAVDLACGTGQWSRQLAAWGMSVRAYDYAHEAVRLAAFQGCWEGAFDTWDINAEPIPASIRPGSVALVTCRNALAYLDRGRLMTDVGRWLGRRGTFYALTPLTEPNASVNPHHRGLSLGQLEQLAAGWSSRQIFQVDDQEAVLVLREYGD